MALPVTSPQLPVRKSIRRLRWFIGAFTQQVDRIAADTGNVFDTDQRALAEVFVEWLRAFEDQKPSDPEDRLPYVGFAAGLMLRTLLRHEPVRVMSKAHDADDTNPAYFWPEGYVYVAFCLNVRALVLEQDFQEKQATVPELSELRTWWSFRENTAADPALAMAFLDLFAGEAPQWSTPDIFRPGHGAQIAARFFEPIEAG
ncbi:MAG: hypothetical protein AAGE76_00780 [Pseudomonadota bacterium]